MDMILSGKVMTIIFVYRPQSERNKKKEKFYDDLMAEVQLRKGKCFVLGDFNGLVKSSTYENDGVHCGFGWGKCNKNDERIQEFADGFDIVVGNTFFK